MMALVTNTIIAASRIGSQRVTRGTMRCLLACCEGDSRISHARLRPPEGAGKTEKSHLAEGPLRSLVLLGLTGLERGSELVPHPPPPEVRVARVLSAN